MTKVLGENVKIFDNMKHIIIILAAALMMGGGFNANAHERCDEEWKKKIQTEKIAFLTVEMDISPEEAQVFWPIYNAMEKEKDQAFKAVMETFNALKEASDKGKTGKELSDCMNAYFDARDRLNKVEQKAIEEFRKVLSDEKIAKLCIAEEKFRRQHIRKLHKGNHEKPADGGQANR